MWGERVEMNPLDWLRTLYGWVGVDYPRLSLMTVIILGAITSGAAWRLAAHLYKTHTETLPTGATVNTTNGSQSPIVPNNHGSVTIKDDHSKDGIK